MTSNLIDSLTATRVYTPLDQAAESDMVVRAQSGDRDATRILLDNYLGTLVNEVDRVIKSAGGFVEDRATAREDAFTDAILVFYRVIEKYRPGRGRFAGLLQTALRNDQALTMIVNRTRAMTVPRATMDRRAAALRAAEGDAERARELAPQFGLTRETYDAITQVFQSNNTVNPAPDGTETRTGKVFERGPGMGSGAWESSNLSMHEPEYVRIEDLHDVKRALAVLDPMERDVICGLYGLEGWPEHSQKELAAELGVSRRAIYNRHNRAMVKIRQHFDVKE